MEAAFFDLDKTVIAKASMVAFGKPLYREGLISRWLLLRALYGQLVYLYLGADEARLARMKDSVLALTKGWEQARVREIVEQALTEVVEPIVYDEALELMREHREAGRKIFIVSASPEEIVAPLAHYLGVDAYLGTRTELDAEGRYNGVMAFYCYGPAKADAMREIAERDEIDLAGSYAYSDSATDIPMLEAVGHAVAVNPDRELARRAKESGWDVRTFANEVRLRDRLPYRPALGVAGGTAVAAGAGVGVWWWLHRHGRLAPGTPVQAPTGSGLLRRFSPARVVAERGQRTPSRRPLTGTTRPGPSWRRTPRGHRG
ncbi:MAG: HAD family hydrolase [Acidimicrobiales bacterium]